jgi:phosphopantothenoylcysteine decarboxylase/phosphopantothenate--cysteine ligase
MKKSVLQGKVVLLGVTGSIAIYKSCEIVRLLKEEGAEVYCLMTEGAKKFIAPLTFKSLSGTPVASDLWDSSSWEMGHVGLAEKAKILIIAPASANCIARLASGMADDILTSTALDTKAPILIAPAMHEGMWTNPATQSNVKRLKSYGAHFVGPEHGSLLNQRIGFGRMSDPGKIVSAAKALLS